MSVTGHFSQWGKFSPAQGEMKFGLNADVDAAAEEDLWSAGALYVPPTVARVHAIASGDANDDGSPAGTGARTVVIQGLDTDWLEISETVTLNGVGSVNTTNSYLRVNRMYVATAGSGLVNAGIITATAATDATVSAHIPIGYNQTQQAHYSSPDGRRLALVSWSCSVSGDANADPEVKLKVREFGGAWRTRHSFYLEATGNSWFTHVFDIPILVPAKSDIKISVDTGSDNAKAAGSFSLIAY